MGKILFITGAGRPVSKSIAIHAAEEGHTLILHSDKEDSLQDLTENLDKIECTYTTSIFNLYDIESYKRVVEVAINKYGKIDALINSDKIALNSSLEIMSGDEFDSMWNVNVKGVFNGIKIMAEIMKNQENGGDIINIISAAGKEGMENWAGYSATMFAVRGLGLSAAKELKQFGIRIMNFFPGFIVQQTNGTELVTEREKQLKPEDVALSVLNAITMHKRAYISEIDILPSSY